MKESARAFVYLTAGLGIGGAAGYFTTKKLLEAKYENELNIQIQEVKDYYKLVRKEGEYASPETVPVEYEQTTPENYGDYENILEGLEYIEHSEEVVTEEEEIDETEEEVEEVPESEYKKEYNRNRNEPYIISVKEFMEDREEYDKTTITYFEDDDVLCDEREEVIPNVEYTVGNEALIKFGELSEDKNIVYVRNERTSTDFEILRDRRSYAEVVLGYKEEKGVKKMREDD